MVDNSLYIFGAGAFIGPRAIVHTGAILGMGSVVIRDVQPFAAVCGNPSKIYVRDHITQE